MTDSPHQQSEKIANLETGSPARSESPGSGEYFAFPLSPVQERMWCADRKDPGNPAYNGSFRWNLEGPLNPLLLERSFNEIVRRHEVLRATFAQENGGPIQIIAPSLELRVAVQDLRSIPQDQRDSELDRLCALEATRRFDLQKGPLIRVGLLRIEDFRYVLTLTIHHIVSDGWSIGLIMEELQKIYGAFAEGRPSPLPELRIQYPDWVVWQRECAATGEWSAQLHYWKDKLANYERLEVPADFPTLGERSTNSAIVSFLLPRQLTDELKEFSNRQGATFFITSLAACMALIERYTGRKDIALGSPLAGRNRTDVEDLIGLFINHVVFRTDATGDPLFTELVARVRETVWETFANQDVPFENVLAALRPGDPYGSPFYVLNFICQREYARASTFVFEFAGLHMSTMPSKSQGALYDLNFFLVEREAGWRLSLEYNTDLYKGTTAQRMLADFRELLEAIASNPECRLSELCPSESISPNPQAAKNRNSPQSSGAPSPSLQAQVPAASDEVYAMPASRSQERFWLLSKFAPENPAFHMPACVRLAGSVSADTIEKSFQALVDRHEILRTTFEESNGQLLQIIAPSERFSLSTSSLEGVAESDRDTRMLELIREEALRPFDLARGPLFHAKLFRLRPDDHVLVVTAHHIIADGWSQNVIQRELWSAYDAIARGANHSLPPLSIQYGDFATWQKEWLASGDAAENLKFWTKQLAGPLPVIEFPADRPPHNRASSRGGVETLLLPKELTQSLKRLGQSENLTMFMLMLACFGVLLHRSTGQDDMIVGSPVANRRAETEPLIGPFAGPVSLRLNFSGDPTMRELLQRIGDVTFDALGHADLPFEALLEKLKPHAIHGRNPLFQIYLFYQTAFLQPRELPGLTITPLPTFSVGTPFEMQIGVIERAEGVRIQLEYNADLFDASSIRRVLDDYRNILEAMPQSLDRPISQLVVSIQAAPRAVLISDAPQPDTTRPRDEPERKLTRIWEDVIGVRPIGLRENYFELGGNSLLAVHLFAEIEKAFGVKLPLATLFDAQTIEELARTLRGERAPSGWSPLVEIQPRGSRPHFFCIHGGGGNVLIYRDLSRRLGTEQPFYGLQSQGLDGERPLLTRIEDMAALYVAEIRKVQPRGPYFLGGYCMGGTVALEMAQQLRAQEEEVALLALFDTINWSRLSPNSASDKIAYQFQRLIFHARNFLLLRFEDQVRFFREKIKVARNRLPVWRGMLLEHLMRPKKAGKSESLLLAQIWEVNDRAILNYVPAQYPGVITDFRPLRNYSKYLDPGLNWDRIAQQGQEIVVLPVYPAGMLVEPFVKDLASALRQAIDKAASRTSVVPANTGITSNK